ncbi:hypothetical protein AC579_2046 [Pseudocercospora musae]|uniref:Uncharacterized protein n=1 Tax=Pseudocercospora musae TaxID=113226 RepID=A0A139ICE2_9PEZI|nr:hypothetical protein AC579_2046 [Pseudocercospora musae]
MQSPAQTAVGGIKQEQRPPVAKQQHPEQQHQYQHQSPGVVDLPALQCDYVEMDATPKVPQEKHSEGS